MEQEKEMKFKETRNKHHGVVSSRMDVVFSLNKEEYDELNKAVQLVDFYTRQARTKSKLEDSDWLETKIYLQNDTAIVSIRAGMAG